MLRIQQGIIVAGFPRNSVSFIDYPLIFMLMFFAKLLFSQALVINLPLPIQYPYIFYHWHDNLPFIDFAEFLKHLFGLKLFWQTEGSLKIEKYSNKVFYPSLDFVPKNIDLAVDIDKYRKAKMERERLLTSKKHQIKMISYHHQLKTFPSVKKLSAFLMRNSLVLW